MHRLHQSSQQPRRYGLIKQNRHFKRYLFCRPRIRNSMPQSASPASCLASRCLASKCTTLQAQVCLMIFDICFRNLPKVSARQQWVTGAVTTDVRHLEMEDPLLLLASQRTPQIQLNWTVAKPRGSSTRDHCTPAPSTFKNLKVKDQWPSAIGASERLPHHSSRVKTEYNSRYLSIAHLDYVKSKPTNAASSTNPWKTGCSVISVWSNTVCMATTDTTKQRPLGLPMPDELQPFSV